MGFSYKDWSSVFYPVGLSTRNYLYYYSRVFNAAEIDSTFYGTPKADTVRRWAEVTPEEFKFCVKVPRSITHDLGLVGAGGLMDEFVSTMLLLEEKLGVILFQFPPSFTTDQFSVLDSFLAGLHGSARFAVEVRHRSWYTAASATEEMLRKHGVAWAATEYPGLPKKIYATAEFLYLRWIGQHGTFKTHTVERIDRNQALREWWDELQNIQEGLDSVYGFFNNDYSGFAPATANRFKEIAGLPVQPLVPPQQAKLF